MLKNQQRNQFDYCKKENYKSNIRNKIDSDQTNNDKYLLQL